MVLQEQPGRSMTVPAVTPKCLRQRDGLDSAGLPLRRPAIAQIAFDAPFQPGPSGARTRAVGGYARHDHPRHRIREAGAGAVSNGELLIALLDLTPERAATILQAGWAPLAQLRLPELMCRYGLTERQARLLAASIELGRRVASEPSADRHQIRSPADAAQVLLPEMQHLDQEHLRTVLLDTKNRVLEVATIYIGSVNSAMIRVGEVFKPAIRRNATALILAHNHPSGDPTPSPEDVLITRQIVEAGKLMDCDVLDHLVVGHGRFVSMKERGLGFTG